MNQKLNNINNPNVIEIPRAYAKELIEASKGIDDGSQLYSDEVEAQIDDLFEKGFNAPSGQKKAFFDKAFRIAGCLKNNN